MIMFWIADRTIIGCWNLIESCCCTVAAMESQTSTAHYQKNGLCVLVPTVSADSLEEVIVMDNNLAYQEEWREELICGKIVAMAPASVNHNFVAANIYSVFNNYLRGKSCIPFTDGTKVCLTETDHFIPDMMVVCDRDKIKWDGVHGTPDFVVEVLSPSTAKDDKKYKKEVYAKCGVREYWIVDPVSKSIEQYLQDNRTFVLHDVYTLRPAYMMEAMTEEERAAVVTHFKCSLYDDLNISLEEIFYRTF